MKYVLRHADDACAFATCGPFVIAIWRGAPTRARLEILLALFDEHVLVTDSRIGVIAVVEEGSPPPTPEVMLVLQPWVHTISRTLAAMAGVFEATGQGADDVRAARERLGGEIGGHLEIKLCFAVEEGCAWIVPRIVPGAEPPYRRALARTVEKVRATIAAPAAKRRAAR